MAISLKHDKVSGVSDGGDASKVQPSDWNAEHDLTAGANVVLGTTSAGAVGEISCTAAGRALLDDADAAAQLATLGAMPVSSGSSLGSIVTAGKVKFHTGDSQLYVSDGTLWRPTNFPGWPRRDGASDEEWEGTNADPPSGYSWDNQDSTAVNVNNTIPSRIVLTRTTNNTSSQITALYKTATVTTTNKRLYANIIATSALQSGDNGYYAGLVARNSSNGKIVFFFIGWDSAYQWNVGVQNWTSSTSFSATVLDQVNVNLVTVPSCPVVLSIASDGTNLTFSYAPLVGGVEGMWLQVATATLGSFIGTWDQIGYGVRKSLGSTDMKVYSDWLRLL